MVEGLEVFLFIQLKLLQSRDGCYEKPNEMKWFETWKNKLDVTKKVK
jgi:hypothetical protein